jgi:DNA repair protein RadC
MNLYSLKDNDLFLDGTAQVNQSDAGKKYILKIRDLPKEDKPREKLIAFGPEVLSVSELVAAVLGVGTKKEEVMSMSSRILKEYGQNALLSQKNPKTVAENFDIPLGKAVQIIACMELGRRFFKNDNRGVQAVRTPRDVFNYAKEMAKLPKEHLRGLYLNSHYKVIHDEVISIGTVDSNIIHPREVFNPAIEHMAVAVILVHNHPSGTLEPSQSDIDITKQLVEASKIIGLSLIDHVIIAGEKFISINVEYA